MRWRARLVTAVVRGATVGAAVLAAFLFSGRLTPAALGGLLCLLLLQRDTPTLLAGLLLLAHATLAARTWKRPRLLTGLASGVALGLLALINAVYQYLLIGVPLICGAVLWLHPVRRRPTAPAFAALVVAAWAVTLPWMVRNATHDGAFGISGGGGKVLAHRAEYGLMTWSEVRSAFAYFLPPQLPAVREAAMHSLAPDTYGYARFDRDADKGFYRRVRQHTGEVAARADRLDPGWHTGNLARQDDAIRTAATDVYLENWPKQIALTAVFAHRGTWGPWLPASALVAFLVWRRRDYALSFLLLPVIWTAAALAGGTHFIERYSYPFIPLSAVVISLASTSCGVGLTSRSGCGSGQVETGSAIEPGWTEGWSFNPGEVSWTRPFIGLGLVWLLARRETRFSGLTVLWFYGARVVASALWIYPLGLGRPNIFSFPRGRSASSRRQG